MALYIYRSISSPASIHGPTEVRPEGLGNIMRLIPMPAGYASYSLLHVRASAIGPSARHNTRPQLFKVLIGSDCDQSELEALGIQLLKLQLSFLRMST